MTFADWREIMRVRLDGFFRCVRVASLPAFLLLYAAMYAAFGVGSPFWPRFYAWRGLTPEQIGLVLGIGTLARLIAGPLIGRLADLLRAVRAALAVSVACAAGAALALLGADRFWTLLLVCTIQAAALAPTTTLADALAVHAAIGAPHQRFEYGWVRGMGSAAFVVGTLGIGQVLGVAGLSSIVFVHAGLLGFAVVATGLVPPLRSDPRAAAAAATAWGGVRRLIEIASFRRVVAVAALVFASHAMQDTFAVIRWTAAGLSAAAISILWSLSVASEVLVFLWIGPAFLDRFGPGRAAALAAVAGIIRWTVMSQTSAPLPVALAQPLHGLTFALLHLACMRLIGATVPPPLAATAQALYAFAAGAATALVMLGSGYLYDRFGAQAFLVMVVPCVLALPLAFSLAANRRARR